ncbi:MAG: YceI family protein [Polyangiales bacterium]|nr:YceI family protein [Myxococcales bacterium]
MLRTASIRFACAAAFAASLAAPVPAARAQATDYELDDGVVRFVCEGDGVVMPAWGRFGAVTSQLSFDPKDLARAKGHVEVLLASVRTEDSGWDLAFREAEFIGADEFPRSHFAIRSVTGPKVVQPLAWTQASLKGEFVLHGVSREVSVPATIRHVPAQKDRPAEVYVRAYFRIHWDEYDLAVPKGMTRTFTGDGALIQVELRFVARRPKPKKPAR